MSFCATDIGLALGLFTWSCLWYYRSRRNDPDARSDLIILIICEILVLWRDHLLPRAWNAESIFYIVHVTLAIALWATQPKYENDSAPTALKDTSPRTDAKALGCMKPLIFPCRTKHTRLFPQRHSFTYPYLLVGIPIGWHDRVSTLLSSGRTSSRGWFHVNSADHLQRDDRSLEYKLDAYLTEQDVDPSQYPYAYLVTAPRFLGYAFNPVSFWYLYDSGRTLKAMILEVNNTFDERRMYFLKAATAEDEVNSVAADPVDEQEVSSKVAIAAKDVHEAIPTPQRQNWSHQQSMKLKFTSAWEKDFHVSPFNSRKGFYSLKAEDVQPWHQERRGTVSNAITLVSSQNHGKLVASVSSMSTAIDPAQDTDFRTRFVITCWAFTGFMTFPRILRQAWRLFFERKLHVWFRPEVTKESIARNATWDERILERYFAAYLRNLTEEATAPLRLHYMPAPGVGHTRGEFSANCSSADRAAETLEVRVTSPAFYSRFIHYACTRKALDWECFLTDSKNQTITISRPDLLPLLLGQPMKDLGSLSAREPQLPMGERFRWNLLRRLRCPPPSQSYGSAQSSSDSYGRDDIRRRPLSPLDAFVRLECRDAWLYRRTAMKLFLAQRLAGGITLCISALDLGLRFFLIAVPFTFRGARCRSSTETLFDIRHIACSAAERGPGTPGNLLQELMLINMGHTWSGLKGLL